MDRRRLKALNLLKRLKKHEMEISARELGELRFRTSQWNMLKQGLIEDMQDPAGLGDIELAPYMQRFLPAAKAELKVLDDSIDKVKPYMSVLEEQVSEKFGEFKTLDILHNSLKEKIHDEQETREIATAEEILLSRWAQK